MTDSRNAGSVAHRQSCRRFVFGVGALGTAQTWPSTAVARSAQPELPVADCGRTSFFQPFTPLPALLSGSACSATSGGPPKELLCTLRIGVADIGADEALSQYQLTLKLRLRFGQAGRMMSGALGLDATPISAAKLLSAADASALAAALAGSDLGQLIGGCELSGCISLFPFRFSFPSGFGSSGNLLELFAFDTPEQAVRGVCLNASTGSAIVDKVGAAFVAGEAAALNIGFARMRCMQSLPLRAPALLETVLVFAT